MKIEIFTPSNCQKSYFEHFWKSENVKVDILISQNTFELEISITETFQKYILTSFRCQESSKLTFTLEFILSFCSRIVFIGVRTYIGPKTPR